jgi:hypothetical protein
VVEGGAGGVGVVGKDLESGMCRLHARVDFFQSFGFDMREHRGFPVQPATDLEKRNLRLLAAHHDTYR